MRLYLTTALLCTTLALAAAPDTTADRAAIEQVVNSLKTAKPASVLFTADADSQLDRLMAADQRMAQAANQPWSEVSAPVLAIRSIRFVTPDVALVDAENTQYGSLPPWQRVPVLLVMKKVGNDWKIASLRVLAPSNFFL